MLYEGQKFCLTRRNGPVVYYHCAQKARSFCRASLREENGQITVIREHNGHAIVENPVARFRSLLLRRATLERTPPNQIYSEERIRDPESALLYPWRTAQSSMNSARRRSNPPIPVSLVELGGILSDVRWIHKFFSTIRVPPHVNVLENFFRQVVQHDGTSSILFASQFLIDRAVAGVTEVHVDGSLEAIPSAPMTHQLLIMHCIIDNVTFPIAYCLMQAKHRQAYDNVFAAIQILAPTLVPAIIITDYERSLQHSLAAIYPDAEIRGSFYHYATAVWRKAVTLDLLVAMRNLPLYRKAVKLVMALPLLPAENILDGLNEIEIWCIREHIEIIPLFMYMRRYWIRTISPEAISVCEQPNLTNTNIQNFNKVLLDKIGPHPNVFDFIEKLIRTHEATLINYTNHINGNRITRPVVSRYLLNDVRIRDAQINLRNELLSFFNYLEIVSYSVDSIEERLVNIQEHIEPIVVEPDDVDAHPDEPRPREPSPIPRLLSPLPPLAVHDPDDVIPLPHFNLLDEPDNIQGIMNNANDIVEEHEPVVAPEVNDSDSDDENNDDTEAGSHTDSDSDEDIFHLPEDEDDALPNDVVNEIRDDAPVVRWKAQETDEDEDVPQSIVCLICLTYSKSYALQCGHTYCGKCTERIFNKQFAVCPECRTVLNEDPRKIFI